MIRLYIPLYDHKDGGPPLGFRCNAHANPETFPRFGKPCVRVLRTERGMIAHLWSVHKIKRQLELYGEKTSKPGS